jgi:UDP-glucuronate decarboxylase
MSEKWVVVFGGAGFLGSHLCESLVNNQKRVICIDNLYTGNLQNIDSLKNNKNFKYINHDIIEKWTTDLEIESIYNLACPASPFHYQKNPIYTLKINFNGALNALELAEEHEAPIMQASTSEIYGDPLEHPQEEQYWGNVNSIGIRSCYDEGKRVAETLFFDFHRTKNINIKVARIFNTYGPNMDVKDGRVVSNFIVQALKNKDITIYGDGSQTRSFCYVTDLIDGFTGLMNLDSDKLGPYNLGNPIEFTVKELAETVIKLISSKSQIIYLPLPSDDPLRRKPDISKATNDFNWSPNIHLEEGLLKTINYFKKII